MFSLFIKYQKDPFRLFFPLGFLLGILGVLPWVFLLLGWNIYPISYHRMVMIGGFLTSFVIGFLMTAVPRFTQTYLAESYEIGIAFISLIIAYILAVLGIESLFYIALLIVHLNVLIFAIKRFLQRKSSPPPTFVFIGISFVIWILSDLGLACYSFSVIQNANWYLFLKNLWMEAAVLGLILGIGGQMVPGILGWSNILPMQKSAQNQTLAFFKVIPSSLIIVILLFIFSYVIEIFADLRTGLILRGLIVCYFAFKFWRIHKLPVVKSRLSIGIWLSAWCFVIGYVLRASWISGGTHALHIIFIGGFTLITFLIATRVTVAHSMIDSSIEKTSKSLVAIIALLLFATLTRSMAILWPSTYFHHLAYAAILWVMASVIWLCRFIKMLVCVRR